MLVAAAAAVCALHAGTRYMAFALGFDRRLGPPLLDLQGVLPWWPLALVLAVGGLTLFFVGWRRTAGVLGVCVLLCVDVGLGPLYGPHRVLFWSWRLRGAPGFEPLLMETMLPAFAAGMTALMAGYRLTRARFDLPEDPETLGSAHFGSEEVLYERPGVVLGRTSSKPRPVGKGRAPRKRRPTPADGLLRYGREGHLMTLAPTGTGKGVGPVVSTLLDYPGSVITTDPKSENFFVTHRARQRMGHHVGALDPFGVVEEIGRASGFYDELTYEAARATFNPLALIDPTSDTAIDVARKLAATLVTEEGDRQDSTSAYFNQEAEAGLGGLLLYVGAFREGRERSLPEMRRLLNLGPREFKNLLTQKMARTDACDGQIRAAANRLLQKAEREYASVISSMHHHTHFLDSPAIRRTLQSSTFDPAEVRSGQMTLYLILPPNQVDAYAGFQRVMIQSFFTALAEGPPPRSTARTLFLLDEFANLGKLDSIVRALTLMRGYGAQIWMIVQNLPDLENVYGTGWKTLLDVNVLQAFGTNDHMTAAHLSSMLGQQTVYASGRSANRSAGGKHGGRSRSLSYREQGRPLLSPDEIRRLGADEQLLYVKGHAPIRARKVRYYRHPELRMRAAPNPYVHESARGDGASVSAVPASP